MIETVYQHGLTVEESKKIGFPEKNIYLRVIDEQSARFDLALLYNLRGDEVKVAKYLEGLPPNMVNDFWRTVTHP